MDENRTSQAAHELKAELISLSPRYGLSGKLPYMHDGTNELSANPWQLVLLLTQSLHGVDPARSSRRQETGKQRGNHQHGDCY